MRAKVYVTFKQAVLDPQGQAVASSLKRLGFGEVKDARVGKYIELELDGQGARSQTELATRIGEMCRKLLANTVIEDYRFEIVDGAPGGGKAA
jgi:phosphoribosylformylglycinamidine synthase